MCSRCARSEYRDAGIVLVGNASRYLVVLGS